LNENQLESFFFFLLAAESPVNDSQPIEVAASAIAANPNKCLFASFIELIFMIAAVGFGDDRLGCRLVVTHLVAAGREPSGFEVFIWHFGERQAALYQS